MARCIHLQYKSWSPNFFHAHGAQVLEQARVFVISGTYWAMDHGLQVTIAVLGTSATKIFLVLEPFSKLDNRTVAAPWESALLSSLPAPALVPGCKPPHIRKFWFLFFERYIFFERYNLKRRIPEQHAKNHVTSTFLGGAFCSDASVSAKPGMAPPPAPCVWTYENWVWIPIRTHAHLIVFWNLLQG